MHIKMMRFAHVLKFKVYQKVFKLHGVLIGIYISNNAPKNFSTGLKLL